MTTINWSAAQQRLTNAGFGTAGVDGIPGKRSYAALFGYVAQRQPDAVVMAIAIQAVMTLPKYQITASAERLAEFLGETCNETGGYARFEENMHYSAKRLMQIWPSRFPTVASAAPFAWDPTDPDREDIALANQVYGSRMGNQLNGTADNDGWDHRGGGMLQHTGAAEYAALKQRLGFDPDDVRDPAKSVIAACDYMERAGTLGFVDRGDYLAARKSINGGLIGYDEVKARRDRALKVLL